VEPGTLLESLWSWTGTVVARSENLAGISLELDQNLAGISLELDHMRNKE
jgi:hypothetical protein